MIFLFKITFCGFYAQVALILDIIFLKDTNASGIERI